MSSPRCTNRRRKVQSGRQKMLLLVYDGVKKLSSIPYYQKKLLPFVTLYIHEYGRYKVDLPERISTMLREILKEQSISIWTNHFHLRRNSGEKLEYH